MSTLDYDYNLVPKRLNRVVEFVVRPVWALSVSDAELFYMEFSQQSAMDGEAMSSYQDITQAA